MIVKTTDNPHPSLIRLSFQIFTDNGFDEFSTLLYL